MDGSDRQSAGEIRWSGTDFEGYDGTQWKSFTADTTGGGGKIYEARRQSFSTNGNFAAPEGVTTVWVSVIGGGGGTKKLTKDTEYGVNGADGGISSFGSFVSVTGGKGGKRSPTYAESKPA